MDLVRTNFYENEHDLFYFGVFNPKELLKFRFRFLVKKISPKSRLSPDWQRGVERSYMLLEAFQVAHFTIINLDT